MIEYIIIYLPDGYQFYSKCFRGFCNEPQFNEEYLIGFVRALDTLPSIIGTEAVNTIDLGNMKLIPYKLEILDLCVVIGILDDSDIQSAQELSKSIQSLAKERFSNETSESIKTKDFTAFKIELYERLISVIFSDL